ncbi:MAG: hypothetical protein GX270_05625 [Clostridiaceae bacterium]|nr:hypothetical protein [Clostridiaceae bacterium]
MIDHKSCVDFFTLVADRSNKEGILKLLLDSRCHLIDVVYAKGSVQSGYFRDLLGLVPEEKKIIITCLIASDLSSKLLEELVLKFNFDKPNTGIAFVVPVEKLSV